MNKDGQNIWDAMGMSEEEYNALSPENKKKNILNHSDTIMDNNVRPEAGRKNNAVHNIGIALISAFAIASCGVLVGCAPEQDRADGNGHTENQNPPGQETVYEWEALYPDPYKTADYDDLYPVTGKRTKADGCVHARIDYEFRAYLSTSEGEKGVLDYEGVKGIKERCMELYGPLDVTKYLSGAVAQPDENNGNIGNRSFGFETFFYHEPPAAPPVEKMEKEKLDI